MLQPQQPRPLGRMNILEASQQDKQTNRLKISLAVSTREGKDAIDFHFVSGGGFVFFFYL